MVVFDELIHGGSEIRDDGNTELSKRVNTTGIGGVFEANSGVVGVVRMNLPLEVTGERLSDQVAKIITNGNSVIDDANVTFSQMGMVDMRCPLDVTDGDVFGEVFFPEAVAGNIVDSPEF